MSRPCSGAAQLLVRGGSAVSRARASRFGIGMPARRWSRQAGIFRGRILHPGHPSDRVPGAPGDCLRTPIRALDLRRDAAIAALEPPGHEVFFIVLRFMAKRRQVDCGQRRVYAVTPGVGRLPSQWRKRATRPARRVDLPYPLDWHAPAGQDCASSEDFHSVITFGRPTGIL